MLFGEQLNENFLKWIANKLGIRKSRFIDTMRHWKQYSTKKVEGEKALLSSHNRQFTTPGLKIASPPLMDGMEEMQFK